MDLLSIAEGGLVLQVMALFGQSLKYPQTLKNGGHLMALIKDLFEVKAK